MATTYTDAALKQEITLDPAAVGYAGKAPFQVAVLLNTPKYTAYAPVSMASVLKWGAANGVLAGIADAAARAGNFTTITAPNRAIALAVQAMLQGGYAALDVTDGSIVGLLSTGAVYTPGSVAGSTTLATPGMLDALVSAGVMTAAQKDSLIGLGQYQASRVQVLFGFNAPVIDADRVAAALRS